MKMVRIGIDGNLSQKLDRVAPSGSRARSRFIRDAIREAIWRVEETETAAAYARQPDSAADVYFDPNVWEAPNRR